MKNDWPFILFVILVVILQQNAKARNLPVFDMEAQVMTAPIIVEGNFDETGLFVVNNVIKGLLEPKGGGSKINIEGGSGRFAEVMGEDKASSFIAFLEKAEAGGKVSLVRGSAGMIAISKSDKVYARLEAFNWGGSDIQAHATWTKSFFLAELNRTCRLSDQLNAILAMPREDKQRTQAILDFAVANGHPFSGTDYRAEFLARATAFSSTKPRKACSNLPRVKRTCSASV